MVEGLGNQRLLVKKEAVIPEGEREWNKKKWLNVLVLLGEILAERNNCLRKQR